MGRRHIQVFHKKGNPKMTNKHENVLGLPSNQVSSY